MSLKLKNVASDGNLEFSEDDKLNTLLLLERNLERSGEKWIEHGNMIEHFLTRVVSHMSCKENSSFQSEFILRRVPTFLVSLST